MTKPSVFWEKPMRLELIVFFLFPILVFLLYWPTRHAGLVTDFIGLMERLDGASAWGIWDCFGFPALQQFLNAVIFIVYTLFGAEPIYWFVLHGLLHTVNGWLVFIFLSKYLEFHQINGVGFIAFFSSLLWLISPFQSEVLVWKVCLNYLMSTGMIVSVLIFSHKWLQQQKTSTLLATWAILLLGLFTFENVLVTPLIILVLFGPTTRAYQIPFRKYFLQFFLPQLGFVGLRFLGSYLLLSSWAGHYGDGVHLRFLGLSQFAIPLKYGAKFTFLTRYLEGNWEQQIISFFDKQAIIIASMMLVILVSILFLVFRKVPKKITITYFFVLAFAISLIPVSNLHFNTLMYVANDRYGYAASIFWFTALVLFFQWLPNILRWVAVTGLIVVNMYFLHHTNAYWQKAQVAYDQLLDTFRWHEAPEVILLALPDNYKGIPMFQDHSGEQKAFANALKYLRGHELKGISREIAQYNVSQTNDGVTVNQPGPNTLNVAFNQNGNWWWRLGLGATNYDRPHHKFENLGDRYRLTFKASISEATFIFPANGKWHEFKFKHD